MCHISTFLLHFSDITKKRTLQLNIDDIKHRKPIFLLQTIHIEEETFLSIAI